MASMGRRQLLVIVTAVAMLLIGAGLVGGLVAATQSDGGREWLRALASRELNRGLRGRLHVGRISGTFLTDLTIDSLELRDPDDSVFLASGPLTLRYDPRDLVDGRFIFRDVEADHPLMVIRKELDETWNFRKIFPADDRPGPSPAPGPARNGFGSLIVFHDIRLRGGAMVLTMPWTPADSLTGARRDSAIAFNLADTSSEIRRAAFRGRRGYAKTYRWQDIDGLITRLRFRHPDSTGRQFDIARVDVNETSPPFRVRNMHGTALWRGDTVWFEIPRFSLPGSVGAANGKVEWPRGGTFWDVHLRSDSTALSDIRWISPSIPAVGHGSMNLHVKSRTDPDLIDYTITDMDVHSRASRLRGTMTFGVGGPVLEVRNVNLALQPADFVFFEALNTRPFPYPWRGTVTGTVHATGGPVNHFQVERADLHFADANVAGATASGTGHGELDILFPGLAKFHGFRVDVDHFDLATPQFLNPEFPRLNGSVSGTATLDSIWTDVRATDADITHTDGAGSAPSRFRGEARVTLGDEFVTFDATAAALPLSATTLARSYPALALRGDWRGPVRASGTVSDFTFATDLTGDAGRVQVDGRFDALEPEYAAVARGSVSGFDLRRALAREAAPTSLLDARFTLDLRGDSVANLAGAAQVDVDRSIVDSVRVFGGAAALRLGDGLLHVDSLSLETVAGTLRARGALGTVASATDTLTFQFVSDSLGGFRRYLAQDVGDSLVGVLRGNGVLTGRVSRFALDATVGGTGMLFRTTQARELRGTVALSALPDSATGSVTLRLDGVRSGALAISSGELRADLLGGWQARTAARLTAPSGVEARLVADVRRRADTTTVRLDSLSARTASNTWQLRRPATVVTTAAGFGLDTLVIAGARGGRLDATGRTSSLDTIAVALRADAVPLADVGELLQTHDPMHGTVTLRADVRGTRTRPDLIFTGALDSATVGGLPLGRVEADGRYTNRRLTTAVALSRGGVAAMHADATLPLDLAIEPAGSRFLEEPLVAHVRTDSAGLGLLESLVPSVHDATGDLRMDVDVSGTWRHPRFTGSVSITGGALSLAPMGAVRLQGVEADIGLLGDSIAVRRIAAWSGADRTATAEATGGISIRDASDPTFALQVDARGFNVLNDPRVADLDLTGNLRLSGRRSAAVLTGGFTVDRGVIRLPELYQKRVISLDDPNLFRVVDTTALANRRLLTT
ncbi:MAG TPA: translocation/assembly module TamB domain-containing protein, partial [Gemmatimonadaceae bacterium]|nr:translocation/assembly module TamB domain-containing protein [Gemmatimonadaceae bacterium]